MLNSFKFTTFNRAKSIIIAALLIMIIAGLGTFIIYNTHASTPFVSINADTGALSSPAVVHSDTTSSDGKSVAFGSSPVAGTQLFNGTFTAGQSISKTLFPEQSFIAGHVTAVLDPDGSGVSVLNYTVPNSDQPYGGSHPRADIITNAWFTEGSILYVSIPIKIPSQTFPAYANNGSSFFQWAEIKDHIGGNPNWGLYLSSNGSGGNNFSLFAGALGKPFGGAPEWTAPLDTKWHTAIIEALWTRNSNGWMKMWWDDQPIKFTTGSDTLNGFATMGAINPTSTAPQPLDINSYRSFGSPTTTTIYHGNPKIGTSLSSVEPDILPNGP